MKKLILSLVLLMTVYSSANAACVSTAPMMTVVAVSAASAERDRQDHALQIEKEKYKYCITHSNAEECKYLKGVSQEAKDSLIQDMEKDKYITYLNKGYGLKKSFSMSNIDYDVAKNMRDSLYLQCVTKSSVGACRTKYVLTNREGKDLEDDKAFSDSACIVLVSILVGFALFLVGILIKEISECF